MPVGDLYRANVEYRVFDQLCVNTFWYRMRSANSTLTNDAQNLAEALDLLYVNPLLAYLTTEVQFESIKVWNYTDGVEYYERDQSADVGVRLSACAPSQWCIGFKFNRPGVGWNYPRKRISGFPIDVYQNNTIEDTEVVDIATVAEGWRLLNRFGDIYEWVVIRPSTAFGLGNPSVTGEGVVGAFLDYYDASQNTRRN